MADNGSSDARFTIDDVLNVRFVVQHVIRLTDDKAKAFIELIRGHFDAEAVRLNDDSIYIRSMRIYIDIEDDDNETIVRLSYPHSKERLDDLAYVLSNYFTIANAEGPFEVQKIIDFVYTPQGDEIAPDYLSQRVVKEIELGDLNMVSLAGETTLHLFSSEQEGVSWIARIAPRYSDPTMKRVYFDLRQRDQQQELKREQGGVLNELCFFWDLAHALAKRIDENA